MERTCAGEPSAPRMRTGAPFTWPMSPQQYPAPEVVTTHAIPSPAVSEASVSGGDGATGAGAWLGGAPAHAASSAVAHVTASMFWIIAMAGR